MHTAAVTTRLGNVQIESVEAVPGPGEALLRVEAVGICGTDLHIFDGQYPVELPLVQGHEISAVVETLPPGYEGPLTLGARVAVEPVVACGTCYACRHGRRNTCREMDAIGVRRPGGFQENLAVPVTNCHPAGDLPADITALSETLSVSLRSVLRAGVTSHDTVLVMGAGPIGLGAVIAARDAGADVMVVDLHDARLELAGELGAAQLVRGLTELPARVERWTDGDGAAVVIEATGVPGVAAVAFDVVAIAGRIAMVGVSEQELRINQRLFTSKELDVYGSRATLDFPGAVALGARHPEAVRKLVSHRFGLSEVGDALAFAHDNPRAVVKTLVEVS